MWTTAGPVVEDWIAQNLGPVGRLQQAGAGLGEVGRVVLNAPDLLTRAARVLTQMDDATATASGSRPAPWWRASAAPKPSGRSGGNAALWVIALALLILALR